MSFPGHTQQARAAWWSMRHGRGPLVTQHTEPQPTLSEPLTSQLSQKSASRDHQPHPANVEPNCVPAPTKCCPPRPARVVFNCHRCRSIPNLPLLLRLPREPAILENVRESSSPPSEKKQKKRQQKKERLEKYLKLHPRLNLKTIVSLTAEKPSKPLRAISEEQGIKLVHLGLWHPSTWEAYQPLSKSAVEKSLRLLTTDNLPALLVDGGHGTFVGVLRKLMGWNHTSIILE